MNALQELEEKCKADTDQLEFELADQERKLQEANSNVQRFHQWLQNYLDNELDMDHFEEKGVGNDSSMLRGLSFTLVMRLKKQIILIKKLWWEEVV